MNDLVHPDNNKPKLYTSLLLCLIFVLFGTARSFAQPSRIELKSHYSPSLSAVKEFNVFFPEGYDAETNRYPVIYLFRGAVDEWADPAEDAARRGNIKTVFDSLYAKKNIGKMILIMPGLSAPATQDEYTYLINDLLPFIDANYRTIPDRWHRAMDGFSLGGTIVTNLLAAVPNSFCSVGSYDGTLNSPYFDNTKFSNANSQLIYAIQKIQLLYHTGSVGGNNNSNNTAVFNILNSKGIYNSLPSFLLDPNAQHNWYYADLHMSVTLPLHWQKMYLAENNLNLTFKKQYAGQVLAGSSTVEWSRTLVPNKIATYLLISSDLGKQWNTLFTTNGNDSSATLNTSLLADGTRYKLKILAAGDSLYGSSVTGAFTINNPGNAAPDVDYIFMNEGDSVSQLYTVQWHAADADGDSISINLEISHNGGITFSPLASSIANTGNYSFDTRSYPNSNNLMFRITAQDGLLSSQSTSVKLILYNKRIPLKNALFVHQSGFSDAVISAVGITYDALAFKHYTISFNESAGKKMYSVFNADGIEIVSNATELDGKTEGPLFNSIRLLIKDFPKPVVNTDSSRWIAGASPLSAEIRLIDVVTESGTVTAIPFASDYEIRIKNSIVDTSLSLFGAAALPVNFQVWNTSLNRKTKFIFVELDGNGYLSRNDELYFVEKDSVNDQILTWHVQFVGNETAANPVSGDTYRIKIMKPLSKNDSYLFIPNLTKILSGLNTLPMQYSLSQNYPNPFNPATKIEFTIPNSSVVSLSVFDILGREIETLLKQKLSAGSYTCYWNADHYPSGVYFYRLHTSEFTQTKKMILCK